MKTLLADRGGSVKMLLAARPRRFCRRLRGRARIRRPRVLLRRLTSLRAGSTRRTSRTIHAAARLSHLNLGTLELGLGNVREAREHFISATQIMGSFKAEGQFRARIGEEAAKEYKGDPYEQMMAYWYLGLTDLLLCEPNMALPSFRSAALADGGTTEERYKSDAASVFLMMAKTYDLVGDHDKAREEYREAAGVYTFRETVDRLETAVRAARANVRARENEENAFEAAYDFLTSGISAGATDSQAPAEAIAAAREFAFDSLDRASRNRDERARLREADPNIISGYIRELAAAAQKRLEDMSALPGYSPLEPHRKRASRTREQPPRLVGIGEGPFKYRTGEYGELARIAKKSYPERYAEVYVDGKPAGRTETIEDIYYQASTRGGREMDALLRGKAVFKSATEVAALGAFAVAALSDDESTEQAALLAGLGLLVASLVTQPQADIRSWETLPDKIQMLAANVPPGKHKITIEFHGSDGVC